eukprot:3359698-Ditylum_brightwellii.AAC.1
MVDIFGDHYFNCKYNSKMWLHKKCCDINKSWFERIYPLAGTAPSVGAVSMKPGSLCTKYPGM